VVNIAGLAINEALMFLRSIGAVREVSIDDANNAEGRAGGIANDKICGLSRCA